MIDELAERREKLRQRQSDTNELGQILTEAGELIGELETFSGKIITFRFNPAEGDELAISVEPRNIPIKRR